MQLWPWPLRVSGKCSYLGASLYLPLSQNKREEGEQNKYKNEGMGKEKRNNQDLRSNWAGTNTFSEGMNSTNTEGTAKDRGNQPSFQGVCCKEPQLMCYSQTGPAKIPTLHFLMQKHTHTLECCGAQTNTQWNHHPAHMNNPRSACSYYYYLYLLLS